MKLAKPKLVNVLITMITAFILFGALPSVVHADSSVDAKNDICSGIGVVNTGGGSSTSNDGCNGSADSNVHHLIVSIIDVLSIIVGAVAIIMIIIGGFRYVISGGNDSSVSGAKNTIIFALVGLVIVALAQTIVHFVLNKINR